MNQSRSLTSLQPRGYYWIWYTLPALLIYVVFMAFPLLDSVRMSFFQGPASAREFVGFSNYVELFTEGELSVRYWNALGNTIVFFLIHMCVQNVLGITFAALLTNRKMRGRGLYQTLIFIPTTFAIVVTGYLWRLILNPMWSQDLLTTIGLPGLIRPWLGLESTALVAVALVSCWQWIGIPTMIFVAAFLGISDDLYEAAEIEGANGWQIFRSIKLPLVLPVAGIVTILTFAGNFNAFDVVFVMTTANGAPAYSTDLLGTLFYRVGIAGQHPVAIPNMGYGATIGTITFVLVAAVSMFVLNRTRTRG